MPAHAALQVPGVRFVTFPAGLIFDFPDTSQGNFCLLVEKGGC